MPAWVALGFQPTRARLAARRVGRQVGDADQVHARRARDLRQVHGAELAGADQADADRLAFGGALLELGVEVHVRRPSSVSAIGSDEVSSALAGMPSFHGRSTG